MEKKTTISHRELCKRLPAEFARYMEVAALQDQDTPEYGKLRDMFRQRASGQPIEYDNVFDWTEHWVWRECENTLYIQLMTSEEHQLKPHKSV